MVREGEAVRKVIDKSTVIRESHSDRVFSVICYAIVILLVIIVLIPLLYVIACSFSSGLAVSNGRVGLWPVDFSVEGYRRVFKYRGIWISYRNTIIYTTCNTFLHLVIVLLAAFPLSKQGLPHKRAIVVFFTITMLFSGGIIPTYLLISDLGMLNTMWAIIIPGAFSFYNMSVCRTFISNNIPMELWDAAEVDGCGPGRFFLAIVLPLSKAVIAVISMQVAIGVWNSYMNSMLYLSNSSLYPLQIVLRNILIMSQMTLEIEDADAVSSIQGLADQLKYALIIVSTLPIMCVYPFVQKYFTKGLMIGSVKG